MNETNQNILREFAKMTEAKSGQTVKKFSFTMPSPKDMFVYSSAVAVVFVGMPMATALAFQRLVNGLTVFGSVGRAMRTDHMTYRQAAAIAVPAWYIQRLLLGPKVEKKVGK